MERLIVPFHGAANGGASATPTIGRVYLELFEVVEPGVITSITWMNVATAAGTVRVGIYQPKDGGDAPAEAALLYDSGDITISGINSSQTVKCSIPVARGKYYVAYEASDNTNTYQRSGNTESGVGWGAQYDRTGGYGPLVNPCPSVSNTATNLPIIRMRLETTSP